MPLSIEKLLAFDFPNINEFWAMHMNIDSDAHEYTLEYP